MSKLAYIKRELGTAGDPAIPLLAGLGAFAGKAVGFLTKKKAITTALAVGKKILPGMMVEKGIDVLRGKGRGFAVAAAPGWRRRGKGITATELRGFHKVANLLRRVGMVPKATRRGVRKICR